MILTKLEPLTLDLQNWRYNFYKIASKQEIFELASNTQSLTSGALGSDDPTSQREEIGEAAAMMRQWQSSLMAASPVMRRVPPCSP